MLILSFRNQIIIGLLLVMMMIVTRGYNLVWAHNLADASWAVFFLAGIYLCPAWPLFGLLLLGWSLDYVAYTWGGVSDFCITPAYLFLIPAYASLWFAGRWYAKQYQFSWHNITWLGASMITGLLACEFFSSGGFYFFSGRFSETSFGEYAARFMQYFPSYAESFVLYVATAIVLHALLATIVQQTHIHHK
ncbi:hypothetical protein W03_19170 [Nitrosomonas sp. PY1]|uniref:hypothetical protein n=1 Tax=Nitrosomonas sp. PY1 TaxID=1803906 RepID=UPI001FC8D39D|nr:hypothetical protein [Nitrosomonas sp. PY1]GKS69913.1 hypothetical protein W03_19170 [Nitrosomonas sp. PY1]